MRVSPLTPFLFFPLPRSCLTSTRVLPQDSLKLNVAEDNFDLLLSSTSKEVKSQARITTQRIMWYWGWTQSFMDVGQALYQLSCIFRPKHHT